MYFSFSTDLSLCHFGTVNQDPSPSPLTVFGHMKLSKVNQIQSARNQNIELIHKLEVVGSENTTGSTLKKTVHSFLLSKCLKLLSI